MKTSLIASVLAIATIGALAQGLPKPPCKPSDCCTGASCPVKFSTDDLLRSGIVSFRR